MTKCHTTADAEAPVPSDAHSLTLGADGPVVLQKFLADRTT